MFIIRLIILLLVVVLLLWLLKRMFAGVPEPELLESGTAETMRQCKYCGVHVPESSIITRNEATYCCQDHADLDQQ